MIFEVVGWLWKRTWMEFKVFVKLFIQGVMILVPSLRVRVYSDGE